MQPLVDAPAGRFRGVALDPAAPAGGSAHVFRGIRYALAPTGERRWRDPVPVPPIAGESAAEAFGPACPQRRMPALELGENVSFDEDCLFLNIWRPARAADTEPLPVMVWLHGGAYVFGAGSQPMYDGATLASDGGVIVVTINYRIGAFGFLDLSGIDPAFGSNLALKDALAALRWVRENIAAFGGDCDRVTVFGESAGGGLVTTLLATPSAAGLFHRAIAQSSPVSSAYGRERAAAVADRVVRALGVNDPHALHAVDADALVSAAMQVFSDVPTEEPGTIAFAPVVDGELVPEPPVTVLREGRALPVPLLIGTNRDEASFFTFMKSPLIPIEQDRIQRMFDDMREEVPETALPETAQVMSAYEGLRQHAIGLGIARDIAFRMPTLWAAEGHSTIADVWLYRFDFATPFLRLVKLGATHGSELAYVWGNLSRGRRDPTFRLGGRRAGARISARMRQRWTAFARGESPDAAAHEAWPRFDADTRTSLVIDHDDRIAPGLDDRLRAGWGDEVLAFP